MSVNPSRVDRARFVIVRDRDGTRHAIARQTISVLREDEDGGTILLLAGGRMVAMPDGLEATLAQIGAEQQCYDLGGDGEPWDRT